MYSDLLKNRFLGALFLDHIFSSRWRARVSFILNWCIALSLLFILYYLLADYLNAVPKSVIAKNFSLPKSILNFSPDFWAGMFYLFLFLRVPVLAVDAFFNSQTYNKRGDEINPNFSERLNFYASSVWYEFWSNSGTSLADFLSALPKTEIGRLTLLRLGVTVDDFESLKNEVSRKDSFLEELIKFIEKDSTQKEVTFENLFTALFRQNESLRQGLLGRGLGLELIRGAAVWAEYELEERDLERRWWTRKRLARIPGLAKDWAYGKTFILERFARDLSLEALDFKENLVGRDRELELIESALLKRSGANAVVVGEPGVGKHTMLLGFVRMISEGKIFPELEHKRVLELHTAGFTSAAKTKGELEKLLIQAMNEAVRAGNIILAIDEFPEFVSSLQASGVNATEVLSSFLSSSGIHILALADTLSFRRILENDAGLMKYFERVNINEPGYAELITILEDLAPKVERIYGGRLTVTYPALEKIATGSVQYLVEGVLPKRAVDLMEEAVEEAAQAGLVFLTAGAVDSVIERKTRVPLGEIKVAEKEKLLRLEEFLHKRVVGQEEAIGAIADAVRRSRAGIKNPQRPIGTFLFLGPTGVGKTETSKALAEVYFGNEEAMVRLDMTEYQSEEDIERLIGSFAKNEAGILTSKIRANPYTVLLLDEFEKSHPKVKNLFLQILDEGFFSDYLGERINMRNTIIIATSNAGSELIWELVNKGVNPVSRKEEIISFLQKEKLLSPELLNRFDALIIFRPLDEAARKEIAKLMLEKLASRLKKQNMFLQINEELVLAVAQGGYDPAFGARPMQRFIQDKVEKIISEKIIKGEIKPGSEFSLSV